MRKYCKISVFFLIVLFTVRILLPNMTMKSFITIKPHLIGLRKSVLQENPILHAVKKVERIPPNVLKKLKNMDTLALNNHNSYLTDREGNILLFWMENKKKWQLTAIKNIMQKKDNYMFTLEKYSLILPVQEVQSLLRQICKTKEQILLRKQHLEKYQTNMDKNKEQKWNLEIYEEKNKFFLNLIVHYGNKDKDREHPHQLEIEKENYGEKIKILLDIKNLPIIMEKLKDKHLFQLLLNNEDFLPSNIGQKQLKFGKKITQILKIFSGISLVSVIVGTYLYNKNKYKKVPIIPQNPSIIPQNIPIILQEMPMILQDNIIRLNDHIVIQPQDIPMEPQNVEKEEDVQQTPQGILPPIYIPQPQDLIGDEQ